MGRRDLFFLSNACTGSGSQPRECVIPLNFLESVLGDDAKTLIKELKTFQDQLGNLHDTEIAINLLGSYLRTGEWGSAESEKVSGNMKFSGGAEGIEPTLHTGEKNFRRYLMPFPMPGKR